MKKILRLSVLCVFGVITACKEKPEDPKTEIYPEPQNYYIEEAFGLSMQMVYVEGGEFTMGATAEQGSMTFPNEKPAHKVKLSSYHIGKCEVTQAQYKAVMGENPSNFKGDNLPVEKVDWYRAEEFCKRLSEKTGKKYVLPTEAQWEYAARGGNKSKGYKYSGSHNLDEVAWHAGNCKQTQVVSTKKPNELGLRDMSGNVWEWCSDWLLLDYYVSSPLENPTGAETGEHRVIRGGSWDAVNGVDVHRVSFRAGDVPNYEAYYLGFRVVCLP